MPKHAGDAPTDQSIRIPDGRSGELPWWEYRAARQALSAFGQALSGGRRFPIRFRKAGVNYTDFSRREVVIDPEVVTDPDPGIHQALVKGALCHEFAHVRYTTPYFGMDTSRTDIKAAIVAQVSNILEDERIDRAMMDASWGTEKYLRFRKRKLWEQMLTGIDGESEDPAQVLTAILHLRYGWECKGKLHPKNQALLDECWPLVWRAWNGISTDVVRACAEEIVRILGLEERAKAEQEALQQLLDKLAQQGCKMTLSGLRQDAPDQGPGGMGVPVPGAGSGAPGDPAGGDKDEQSADRAPGRASDIPKMEDALDGPGQDAKPGEGEPNAEGEGEGDPSDEEIAEGERDALKRIFRGKGGTDERHESLHPRQVEDGTIETAAKRSQVLVRQLKKIPPRPRSQAVEFGPRYSFRDEERNADRAFRKRDLPTRQRTVALGVLVDCSGSMSPVMEEVASAVLATERAARELRVPFAVWGFSSWRQPAIEVLGFTADGATAPERINGLVASGGTILAPALQAVGEAMRGVRADRRVLLVIHDGQPSDMAASTAAVNALRRELEVVGVFLGDGDENADLIAPMRELFGQRLVVAPDPDALMVVLGAFLSRLLTPPA
jgi:Mg-chelatase subunit ChlD